MHATPSLTHCTVRYSIFRGDGSAGIFVDFSLTYVDACASEVLLSGRRSFETEFGCSSVRRNADQSYILKSDMQRPWCIILNGDHFCGVYYFIGFPLDIQSIVTSRLAVLTSSCGILTHETTTHTHTQHSEAEYYEPSHSAGFQIGLVETTHCLYYIIQ